MIELRVYASLLSRRAQTFLLTVQSVLNCRDHRLLEKLPKAELSLDTSLQKRNYKNTLVESVIENIVPIKELRIKHL